MDCTEDFLEKANDLKHKLYKKYSPDEKKIKETIKSFLVELYGKDKEVLIEQKLNMIKIASFIEYSEFTKKFIKDFSVINPFKIDPTKIEEPEPTYINKTDDKEINELRKINDHLEKMLKELDIDFAEYETIYDEDAKNYMILCENYYKKILDKVDNVEEDIYGMKIEEDDFFLNNPFDEYKYHVDFYDCLCEDIDIDNLLIKKELSYTYLKSLKFKYGILYTFNLDKNLNRKDIIIVNPFIKKDEAFNIDAYLVNAIIRSINTEVTILDNNNFEVNKGLFDSDIENPSPLPKEVRRITGLDDIPKTLFDVEYGDFDDKPIEDTFSLSKIYNNFLTSKLIDRMNEKNVKLLGIDCESSIIDMDIPILEPFFETFEKELLDVFITKNVDEFYNKVGQDFDEFLKAYYEVEKYELIKARCEQEAGHDYTKMLLIYKGTLDGFEDYENKEENEFYQKTKKSYEDLLEKVDRMELELFGEKYKFRNKATIEELDRKIESLKANYQEILNKLINNKNNK